MPQLRLLPFAVLLTCVLPTISAASVTIDWVERRAYAVVSGQTPDITPSAEPGDLLLEAFSGGPSGQAQAYLDSFIDPSGLSITAIGAAGVMTNAIQYSASANVNLVTALTLDSPYEVSLFGNVKNSQFVNSIIFLADDSANDFVFLNESNGPFAFHGILQPGRYTFRAASEGYVERRGPESFEGLFEVNFVLTPLETSIVPEPASIAVWSSLGLSCVGMTALRRRRRSAVVVA